MGATPFAGGIKHIMTKWEYGTELFHLDRSGEGFYLQPFNIEEKLREWGKMGFELVSVISYQPGSLYAFFKKPSDL